MIEVNERMHLNRKSIREFIEYIIADNRKKLKQGELAKSLFFLFQWNDTKLEVTPKNTYNVIDPLDYCILHTKDLEQAILHADILNQTPEEVA